VPPLLSSCPAPRASTVPTWAAAEQSGCKDLDVCVSDRLSGVDLEYANWVQSSETYVATRILIADDSPVVRQCLGRLLCGRLGWEVCGEASDGEDAVRKAQELTPDVVVLDFMMPGKNGLDVAREIGKLLPRIPILLCSVFLTPQLVDLARGAGIVGTLSKGDLNKVIPCVETLLRGGTFFSNHQLDGHGIPDSSGVHRDPVLSLQESTDGRTFNHSLDLNAGSGGREPSCGIFGQGTQSTQ
jgi:CheY-like chemotaxis protein